MFKWVVAVALMSISSLVSADCLNDPRIAGVWGGAMSYGNCKVVTNTKGKILPKKSFCRFRTSEKFPVKGNFRVLNDCSIQAKLIDYEGYESFGRVAWSIDKNTIVGGLREIDQGGIDALYLVRITK